MRVRERNLKKIDATRVREKIEISEPLKSAPRCRVLEFHEFRCGQDGASSGGRLHHFLLPRQELSGVVVRLVEFHVVRLLAQSAGRAEKQLQALRAARHAHERGSLARRRFGHQREAEREGGVDGVEIARYERQASGDTRAAEHPEILRRKWAVLFRSFLDSLCE